MHGFHRSVRHRFLSLGRHRRQRPIRIEIKQHRTPRRPPFRHRLIHLADNHTVKLIIGAENTLQSLNGAFKLITFSLKLNATHFRQAAQPQVKNVLGLNLIKIKHRHQPVFRLVRVIGRADDLDDLIDIHQREQQTINQVKTLQRFLATEFATPADHGTPVRDPHLKHLFEPHGVWATVNQRDVIHGETVFKRRVLEQLGEYGIGVETCFDFNNQPRAVMPIRQINRTGNAFKPAIFHTVTDPFQHAFRADHERQLSHDNRFLACRDVFDMRGRTGDKRATSGLIRLPDTITTDDDTPARPVRPGHIAHQFLKRGVRMPHEILRRLHNLTQIMGRHIRRHTHGDTRSTVDQQIRNGGRQHGRLFELIVIVRREINRILVDIRIHAKRGRRQPRLGVTRGGRAIIKRTEITVTVNQRQPHGERLSQTHHRLIDRRITVRVKLTHHLTDHAGGFHIRPIRRKIHLPHLVDDAPLHGLQPVTGIRQRTRVNHRIGVFKEGLAHLVLQRRFDDVLLDRPRIIRWACRLAV